MGEKRRSVTVLRLGHRTGRDPRISTHLGLTSRVYGAREFVLAGDEDSSLLQGLIDVSERFGGDMVARHEPRPLGFVRKFVKDGGVAVHMTMYGLPYQEACVDIRETDGPLLIVVGGAKVPREYFEECQFNVAIGNQPHSEVAALAGFLERLNDGVAPPEVFSGGQIEVFPSESGKDVRGSVE